MTTAILLLNLALVGVCFWRNAQISKRLGETNKRLDQWSARLGRDNAHR